MVCGRDSDSDGYPDMKLNCDDIKCAQVSQVFHIYILSLYKSIIVNNFYGLFVFWDKFMVGKNLDKKVGKTKKKC